MKIVSLTENIFDIDKLNQYVTRDITTKRMYNQLIVVLSGLTIKGNTNTNMIMKIQ